MHRNLMAAALAGALSVGPLTAHAAQPDATAQKQQVFAQAPYTFSGKIASTPNNRQVAVTPYNQTQAATLRFDLSSPVFQQNAKISQATLAPGTDVRVHYKAVPGAPPEAMAIEVLQGSEVASAQQEMQQLAFLGGSYGATAQATPTAPTTSGAARENVEARASGAQNGTIVSATADTLVLDPYQTAAGNANLKLDPNTPVFQGDTQLSTSSIKPGSDVRVFFKENPAARPSVVAIELLDAQQAAQLRAAEQNVPNRSK